MKISTRDGVALLAIAALLAGAACSRDGDGGGAAAATQPEAEATEMQTEGAGEDAEKAAGLDEEEASDMGPALAQQLQLVRLGGTMQALAETCGVDYDPAALASAKEQQRESLKAQGVPERQFDMAYKAAYEEGKGKLAAAGAAERAEACAQMKQFEEMGQAMQQR